MAYQPNHQCIGISAKPTILCGPSGVGKGTLFKTFQAQYPQTMSLCVSHTTRAPRKGEIDGVHYHFVSKEEFIALDKRGAFAEVTRFGEKWYGTSFQAMKDVMEKNQICLLEIHFTAAIKIRKLLQCNCIFVTTSGGLTTLKQRLIGRQSESVAQIECRLEAAKEEFEFLRNNPGFFDAIIYNDENKQQTVEQLAHHLSHWYPNILCSPKVNSLREEVHCTLM